MKQIKHILSCLLIFFTFINTAFPQSARPGIECGCTKYGDYVLPKIKEILAPELTTVQEGHSKNGTYQLEAVKISETQTSITITTQGEEILTVNDRLGGWGFSPDEHRFVIYGVNASNWFWYALYDLNPDPSDDHEDAEELYTASPSNFSSAHLAFSPHGQYLLFAGIGNSGGFYLKIFNWHTESFVYDVYSASIYGSASGKSIAGWGFSPDSKDATFVHAFLSSSTKYVLNVKDLSSGSNDYVLHSTNNSGGALWRFSPCGDYFMWMYDSNSGESKIDINTNYFN